MKQPLVTDLIQNIPMFSTLDDRQLQLLQQSCAFTSHKHNEILFHLGDKAGNVFIIISGEVDIIIETDISPETVTTLQKDELFGEMAVLNDTVRNATLRARGDLTVLQIPAQTLLLLISENKKIALEIMRQLSSKLSQAQLQLASQQNKISLLQAGKLNFRDPSGLNITGNKQRFIELWQRNLLKGAVDQGKRQYELLINAYNEPQRVYHTQKHIEDCLSLFDRIKLRLQNPDALELAIWYHDIIYHIGSPENERTSAHFFMHQSKEVFDSAFSQRIYNHIIATLHNRESLDDPDTCFMVDIDLSSFGKHWDIFIRDGIKVRDEMSHVPDDTFYRNQSVFHKTLLRRKRFYQSDYFYQHYEYTARKNLTDYFSVIDEKIAASGRRK